jgi:phospholipid/cholesterol/gamma-HCH transport system substrate-binding protein
METRANHVMIGAFTVLVMLAAFGFAIWLAKIDFDREWAIYDILFDGPVSGLGTASAVRFNGIGVGEVTSLRIEPNSPNKVRVRIRIGADTPVKTDSLARLELQGVTGVQIVQITGGSVGAPPPQVIDGQDYPIITSAQSAVDRLIAGAPDLLNGTIAVVNDIGQLVDATNREQISGILNNLNAVTAVIAARGASIGQTIDNTNAASRDLAKLAANFDKVIVKMDALAGKLDTSLDRDVTPLLADARKSLQSITALTRDMDTVIDHAGPGLIDFADSGLPQMNRFLLEARQLVATMDRVLQRLESDPARFLLGRNAQEVAVPQ